MCGWKQERHPGGLAGQLVSWNETIGSADLLKRRNLVGKCEKTQTREVFEAVPTWAKNHTDISVLPMCGGLYKLPKRVPYQGLGSLL